MWLLIKALGKQTYNDAQIFPGVKKANKHRPPEINISTMNNSTARTSTSAEGCRDEGWHLLLREGGDGEH